ncbi:MULTISPECIES: hypothetical protein [unclassified Mesorhizobium]|uniref:hypothetical protein n=1 Tax=unclassified Mesorhizobium TaxID=325217 RepID=UPI002418128B|nr:MULTISPECIES: hypothetical protein [unclassified Mesorhizobium]MDG4901419.1 hypothetical protein [Mesorhizobium sp. WSM4962]MDG4918907.1 hypothetical protein [Mesorhizobium sp. WSM4989]
MAKLAAVDKQQRERVRQGLVSYKKLHGIGDTILCDRIIHVLGVDQSAVPLSTLQRFILGKYRTDDVMVRRYGRFLASVAPPPASDEFGAALAKFILPVSVDEGWKAAFPGEYHTFFHTGKTQHGEPAKFAAGCSTVRLEQVTDAEFLRATEFVIDREEQDGTPADAPWLGNTGVFAPLGNDRYLMIVRSFLEVRLCTLRKVLDAPMTLHGHAVHADGMFPLAVEMPGVPKKEPVREFVMTAVNAQNEKE